MLKYYCERQRITHNYLKHYFTKIMYSLNYQMYGKEMYDYGYGYFFTIVEKIPESPPKSKYGSDGIFRGIFDSRETVVEIIKREIISKLKTNNDLLYAEVFEMKDIEQDDYCFRYSGPLDEGENGTYFLENNELVCDKTSRLNILNCPISNNDICIYDNVVESN